ncbi:NAD(P)-dependent dehydrogenase (short-subunit alcohol dehydrogenase family) [Anaerosolibacter carboniphilus]|uniref:NAD(P)-dependent dehydrogenase (Short-subunit alcohol dehydrogenase family) n=1 Tax=Anaerosolibacter carboniphilus TaxID=1417629 RepID=A0A841L0H3_9FIRM|nr:SDR family oxidoreductase [Anaerosolibacter carboniphilus]MBB6217700.1 NAD(P)-dependent dehydrogenase (short-subunit alcohol dehydrogenase family) [Anaerosolibacter carboniphilus]
MSRFQGKVVIITGGAQGIGMAISRFFAQEGALVVIADIDQDAARENETYILQQGGKCISIATDVACETSVVQLMDTVGQKYGHIDILVNNAAVPFSKDIETRTMDEWHHTLAVNLTGPYMAVKYGLPYMKNIEASIINIASTRALMSEPNTEPYSASKGGLLSLTHSLAISLGKYGIRVNAISPGWIDVSAYGKEGTRQQALLSDQDHKQHPAGRVGRPEDIAKACLFLCSEDASFITGTNLTIDGGMTVKMIYEE